MSSELRLINPWGSDRFFGANSFVNIKATCKTFAGSRLHSSDGFLFRGKKPIERDVIVSSSSIITALQVLIEIKYSLNRFQAIARDFSEGRLLIARGWRMQQGQNLNVTATPPRDFGCRGSGSWGIRASLPEARSPGNARKQWVMTELHLVAAEGAAGAGLSLPGGVGIPVGGSSGTHSESFRFQVNLIR